MTAPVRTCMGCGQTDDHPRHTIALPQAGLEASWHMDCHARANPPCDICAHVVDNSDGKQGDDLRTHLTTQQIPDLDHPEHGLLTWGAPQDQVPDQPSDQPAGE